MEEMYAIAVLILSGILLARIIGKLKFPDVTAYLLAGILIGPSVLGLLSFEQVKSMEIISEVALAFIAFSVGSEMNIKNIQKIGGKILLVTIFEALGAFIIVSLGSHFIFKESWGFAIVLGSISCATAPAATLMVIKQYKAKGDLVDILIPVVALDDAVGIIIFGISSSIAIALQAGTGLALSTMVFAPLWEIIQAILIGLAFGFVFILASKKVKTDDELFSFSLAIIFLAAAASLYLKVSSLLALMAMGLLIANVGHVPRRYQSLIGNITPPIFIAFFVLSGADLNLKALTSVGAIGIFYVLGRVLGKLLGTYSSTKITGFGENIQKYLGLTLVPQAGVAIGLSLVASRILPDPYGSQVRTVILGATIIYELVGPLTAKYALTKAGQIESKKIKN
ncbi:MAG: cation:proton antiporter [Bacillota bacterium]|nr:cation:proton antiporter [Bacillota bacterium]